MTTHPELIAIVDYKDDYVQPLILSALNSVFTTVTTTQTSPCSPVRLTFVALDEIWDGDPYHSASLRRLIETQALAISSSSPHTIPILQISPYEAIDFDYLNSPPLTTAGLTTFTYYPNSYMIRKALIRKHYLAATVDRWTSKHPCSMLAKHVRRAEHFELDYAEFLDDALVECWDLRASMERNIAATASVTETKAEAGTGGKKGETEDAEQAKPPHLREWWILKPSMSDRGHGIRLFSTVSELQEIFDAWEEQSEDADDCVEEDVTLVSDVPHDIATTRDRDHDDAIPAAQLRHFIVQPYIHPPLLLPPGTRGAGRKWHVRVYVVAAGALRVWVYGDMLMLFAPKPYRPPWECVSGRDDGSDSAGKAGDTGCFLTNTCLHEARLGEGQGIEQGEHVNKDPKLNKDDGHCSDDIVQAFWSSALPLSLKKRIFTQICAVVGELFEAAAREMMEGFSPVPGAFEIFGVDFLVDRGATEEHSDSDEQVNVWLLEVNSFPDFRQTGSELEQLIRDLWVETLKQVVPDSVFPAGRPSSDNGRGVDKQLVLVKDLDLGERFRA